VLIGFSYSGYKSLCLDPALPVRVFLAMERPLIVFGTPDPHVEIWKYMPDIDLMVNAILWRWRRPHVNRLWIDSGGYQIMVKGLRVRIDDIIAKYRSIDADVYMSLDTPPKHPCLASKELIDDNVRRFEYLYTKLEDKKIIPVIHCYPPELIIYALEKYEVYGVDMIAYGGAVPPTMGRCGRRSRFLPILGLALLRKAFNGWIHALGIGGTCATYCAMKALGVDSFDSSSWRVKAAYGKIIVPGLGERYVGNGRAKFGRKDLSEEEYVILEEALRRSKFPLVDRLGELLSTFQGRALINAWIVRHYPNVLSPRNGLRWMVRFAEDLASMSIDEVYRTMEQFVKENIESIRASTIELPAGIAMPVEVVGESV